MPLKSFFTANKNKLWNFHHKYSDSTRTDNFMFIIKFDTQLCHQIEYLKDQNLPKFISSFKIEY